MEDVRSRVLDDIFKDQHVRGVVATDRNGLVVGCRGIGTPRLGAIASSMTSRCSKLFPPGTSLWLTRIIGTEGFVIFCFWKRVAHFSLL